AIRRRRSLTWALFSCHRRVPFTAEDSNSRNDDHYSQWLQSRNCVCRPSNNYPYDADEDKAAANVDGHCVRKDRSGDRKWYIPGSNNRNIRRTEPIRIVITCLE